MQLLFIASALALGLVVLLSSSRRLIRSARAGEDVVVATIAVVGVVIYETRLIGSGIYFQIGILTVVAAFAVMLIATQRARWSTRLTLPLFTPALVTGVLFASNALSNPTLDVGQVLARFAPTVFWILLALVLGTGRISLKSVGSVAALALAVATMTNIISSDVWRECDQFKCGVLDAIYTGPFPSENYLAKIAAVSAILAITAQRGLARWATLALAAVSIFGAVSRTAAIAAILAVAVGWIASKSKPLSRQWLVSLGTAATAAVSAIMVATAESSSYSNRGHIWKRALEGVGNQTLFGVGIDRWAQLQAIGAVPANNFPHNQLILLLFAGGIIACAAYLFMLVSLTTPTTAKTENARATIALVAYILISGLTEVMWNPATIDGNCFAILVLVLASATAKKPVAYSEPRPRSRRRTNDPHFASSRTRARNGQ